MTASESATLPALAPAGFALWRNPVIFAVAWLVFDGFFLDMGMPSVLLCFFLTLLWLPWNLLVPRYRGRRKERLMRYGLYMVAALLALGVKVLNTSLAHERADSIIAAVEQYKTKKGAYPERLNQLVPEFLPAIPRAKIVISDFGFIYTASADRHDLMYVGMPPFGRRVYGFERREWSSLD